MKASDIHYSLALILISRRSNSEFVCMRCNIQFMLGFGPLFNHLQLSPLGVGIPIAIAVLSGVDAFRTDKAKLERTQKCVIAILSISLIFVQSASNRKTNVENDGKLQERLQQQKQELTQAFQQGTNQLITLSAQEADKTRRAAKDQTRAIRGLVTTEELTLKNAGLGTETCPEVASIQMTAGRLLSLAVINTDKQANMYDINIHLIEWAPKSDGVWSKIIQEKVLNTSLVPPERGVTVGPFEVLSYEKTADFQVDVTTRGAICWGRLDLRDEGGDVWRNESTSMIKSVDAKR